MTLCNPTNLTISQAITVAVDGVLAKYWHEHQELLRDFIGTIARIFIQQKNTTQIFEEDDEDERQDQVMDFTSRPIYDVYEDELCTTLNCNFCREPRRKSDMKSHWEDKSSQDNVLSPIVILDIHDMDNSFLDGCELGRYYKNVADGVPNGEVLLDSHYYKEPLFYEEETQGYVHKVSNGARTSETQRHINYGLEEKDCPQHLPRKPPDRDQNKEHSFETQERRSIGSTYTKSLEETGSVLKLEHDREDLLKHALENRITYLQKALVLEKEKNMNLEQELNETHKKIRMLNKGSATLDKILSMGRKEKSAIGLGYQGDPSSSQTVFVHGRSVEKNKTRSDLVDGFSYVAMSAPLEWLDAQKCSRTEKGLHSIIDASQTTGTRDMNLTTATYLCGTSLGAHFLFLELPWTYGRRTSCDSFGNPYGFALAGKHINLFPKEETMDPLVPNEEYLSLSSPLCLYSSAAFRSEAKLFGEVQFIDVMFVLFPMSYIFLTYYSTASLQKFHIHGTALDVSSFHHCHLCALMHSEPFFVGKGIHKIQAKWLCLMGSEVVYMGYLTAIGENKQGTSMALVRLMVKFAVALMTDLLGISKRLKLILNSASKSLSFGHSSSKEEETISLVLGYYLLCFPSFETEELDIFNTIHEQLLSSLHREMEDSGSTILVIFCSCYALSHAFHCTGMALVLETRVTLVFFTGSIISHTSLPGFLHVRMILVVTERVHVVVSFSDRPALFLPWFSGKLVMTGFSNILFSELVRIAQISLHHPIFDLLIDQKSFWDREKYKLDIKCLVAKIACFLSTTTMEWTDVACASSKWVICSFFHHCIRFVRGAVILGSPSCLHWSLLLWGILKDVDEFIDTRSTRLTVLVAVTLIHAQLCLVQSTCLLCCLILDLPRLIGYDFSLDDVVNVPTNSEHTFCYLRTREHVFQEKSMFSCALWKLNLVFSNIYNGARVFSRELNINNWNIQLVQVKKSVCVAYRVHESPTFLVGPFTLGIAPDFTRSSAQATESEGSYGKLKARKIGPLEILEKFNANTYSLALPRVHTADVFNIKHLFKFGPHDALLSGFVDESLKGGET